MGTGKREKDHYFPPHLPQIRIKIKETLFFKYCLWPIHLFIRIKQFILEIMCVLCAHSLSSSFKKFTFFSGKPQLYDAPSLSNPKRDPCFVYKTRLTTSILRDIDQYVFYVATRGQHGEMTVLGRPHPLIHALFSCQSQTGCWRMGGAASWGALGALGTPGI